MKGKHTPGPWRAEKANSCMIILADMGYGVARTYGTGEEDKANAALLATTPELLEVCKRTISDLGSHGAVTQDTFNLAKAAIAKAEPEASHGC